MSANHIRELFPRPATFSTLVPRAFLQNFDWKFVVFYKSRTSHVARKGFFFINSTDDFLRILNTSNFLRVYECVVRGFALI